MRAVGQFGVYPDRDIRPGYRSGFQLAMMFLSPSFNPALQPISDKFHGGFISWTLTCDLRQVRGCHATGRSANWVGARFTYSLGSLIDRFSGLCRISEDAKGVFADVLDEGIARSRDLFKMLPDRMTSRQDRLKQMRVLRQSRSRKYYRDCWALDGWSVSRLG